MINYEEKLLKVGKIVCVGRNYVEHIEELKNELPENMVVFMKPASALSDTLHSLHVNQKIHYEGEICFLVQDNQFVGVGFGLDLTKRELQSYLKEKGLPWERAKCFDGSVLLSSFVKIEPSDIQKLSLKLYINTKLIQDGNISQMIYKPSNILEEIQSFAKLDDFDVVMSGTPKGVGEVKKGDEFLGSICLDGKTLVEKRWIAE